MSFLNRFKYARDSYLITILIVVIALMVNFIASRHFFKVDLTKHQLYEVSDASKEIMNGLEDIVKVQVIFSDKLPPNLFAVRQYVDDMLDELSSYAGGNLLVEFLNPEDPDVRNEALRMGIPQIQMNIVEKDKLEVKNGFLGIAVTYGDRFEVLPVVQNILNVEYDLVASVKKVISDETKVVGFVTGHDEPPLETRIEVSQQGDSYSFLKRALDRNYNVKSVDLLNEESLSDVDTLVLAGSKTSYSEEEIGRIDQFFMKGGHLVVLLDGVLVSPDLKAGLNDLGLDDLFSHYGFSIEDRLALDVLNERASFNQGFVNFIVSYPFWIKGIKDNFDPESPIVNQLDSVVFPWTSPLSFTEAEGVKVTPLARTTKAAWANGEPFNLDPNSIQTVPEKGQFTLAAILDGDFKPFSEPDESFEVSPGRILVVGNSYFVTDRFLRLFGQNLTFIMNAIDYLTLDESLITIRSKSAFDLPLKDLTIRERQVVKFIGILLVPLMVIGYGALRSILKKRKKVNL